MIRFRTLTVSSLLFAAACASGSSPSTPGGPGTPATPGPDRPATPDEQTAVTLGMSVMSSNAAGAPRLMRSVVPRTSAAGLAPAAAARDHVAALAPLWVHNAQPMALVENGTQQLRNGATIVKLNQQVDGAIVHNGELRVMMAANGSLVAVSGTLVPASIKPKFASSPSQALDHALDQFYGKLRARPAITEAGERGGWMQLTVAAAPQMRVTQARARRELASVGGKLSEVWSVEVLGDAAPDPMRDPSFAEAAAHRYLVSDANGQIVSDANLVKNDAFLYRVYAEQNGIRRPLDGALESFAPHPTGVPDGSGPGFATQNLVVMDSFNQTMDKWLPDNATTTSGNNVDAFSDLDGTGTFTDGDVRPEVREGRTLNFHYDTAAEALANDTQLKAGAVNVFFITNWMHDWWYDSGFTEAAGNAQVDNYGRGGVDGDPLVARAQANALGGSRNNANMSTPSDGLSPAMNMFLWTPGTNTALTAPSGAVHSEAFANGPHTFDLTADIAAAVDATAPTNDGCQPLTVDMTGKIAVLTFSGVCGSGATVNNAKAAGAIGVILVDGALDDPRAFAGSATANIPGLAVGRTDGAALLASLAGGPVTITLHSAPTGPERDGDLDNTVVAHEWGHYLHHRLAVCDNGQQCGGMSEGWGDFNALLMVLRDGDNRDGTYALAAYATADGSPDTAYFGIRRFPYSLDRTKNDLRFRHIGDDAPLPTSMPGHPGGANSEVHNTGEVWASMLWEVFNVLIDEHGVPVARRRMSDYVVAGLMLTPPEATFTEARDAILAAASGLDSDDMLLMAAAFAGRGAGSCAVAPSNDVSDNSGVIESGTLAARLAVSSATLTEDGVSCDHDGYLDPGESGTLRVTIVNAGVLASENVTVTATTSTGGVTLGKAVHLAAVQPFTSVDLTIPVSLALTAPRNTALTITLHLAGDETCDKNGVSVGVTQMIGVDEVLASSKTDHVETVQTPWTLTGDSAATLWGRATEANLNHTWFGKDAGFPSDTQLVSPVLSASATEPFVVTFSHAFDLEGAGATLFDGGVIEVSTDGGLTFTDVEDLGVDPGYTGTLVAGGDNPINGRRAFSGTSPGFPARSVLSLDFGTQFAGQSVQIRFRLGADANTAFTGWIIDDIAVSGITNTPFPALISEPDTCAAHKTQSAESGVFATHGAPATSLGAFDNAVCVLGDNQ
jgi:large repetitive protein